MSLQTSISVHSDEYNRIHLTQHTVLGEVSTLTDVVFGAGVVAQIHDTCK